MALLLIIFKIKGHLSRINRNLCKTAKRVFIKIIAEPPLLIKAYIYIGLEWFRIINKIK